jgi:hypothetical protein
LLTAPIPVGVGLVVGTVIADDLGRTVWTLDEPLSPGTRPDVLVVRGVTEGDRLHIVADATVVAHQPSEAGFARLVLRLDSASESPLIFPIGSTLVTGDGTTVFQLTHPVRLDAAVLDLTAQGRPMGDLAAVGARLSLVHPDELRVVGVGPSSASDRVTVELAADVHDPVVAGAVLGLVGHPLRSPVLASSAASGGVLVTAPIWQPGDRLRLGEPEASRPGVVAQAMALDDVVHVDPASLVWSGPHLVDIVAG